MTDNPYSTPALNLPGDSSASMNEPEQKQTLGSIAKSTFLAWERLRIVFIVVLGLFTVLLAGPYLTNLRTVLLIVKGAMVANVCYFAGPIIETYVRWLGYEGKWIRGFLFLGGTLLTAILALETMVTVHFADQG